MSAAMWMAVMWALLTGAPVTQCVHEDSVPVAGVCVWDAGVQGDGQGAPFVALPDGSVIR